MLVAAVAGLNTGLDALWLSVPLVRSHLGRTAAQLLPLTVFFLVGAAMTWWLYRIVVAQRAFATAENVVHEPTLVHFLVGLTSGAGALLLVLACPGAVTAV